MIKQLDQRLEAAHIREIEAAAENGRISAELRECEERLEGLKKELAISHTVRDGLREELEAMTERVLALAAQLRHPSQFAGTIPIDPTDQEL